MSRQNDRTIKETVESFLKNNHLTAKLNEAKLISNWEKMMGKTIAKYTRKIYLQKTTLFLEIESATLRHELSYSKDKMLEILNKELGEKAVENIVFR